MSNTPANECEKLLAHVEGLPDYWDGLRGEAREGDSPDRKDDEPSAQVLGHFSHHTTFLSGCAKLTQEQSECIRKASTWVQYQACDVEPALREGAEEGFRKLLAEREQTAAEGDDEGTADCDKLNQRTMALATRFLPDATKKKFLAAVEPDAKRALEQCKEEAPSKQLGACVMAAKNLASSSECYIRIGPVRKKASKKAGSEDDPGAIIAELERLADEMCACKDKVCAEKVGDKLIMFSKRHSDTKPDKATMERAAEVSQRLSKCQSELLLQP